MDETGEAAQAEVLDGAEGSLAAEGRPLGRPVTARRFLGALVVACGLLFVMLVIMALAGLGPLGIAPALVVAVAFTSRITGIRRMWALVALGALSFVIVVVLTYAVAIAVILAAGG